MPAAVVAGRIAVEAECAEAEVVRTIAVFGVVRTAVAVVEEAEAAHMAVVAEAEDVVGPRPDSLLTEVAMAAGLVEVLQAAAAATAPVVSEADAVEDISAELEVVLQHSAEFGLAVRLP